jgi:putative CocE/NonD family hydrolase
VLARLDKIKVPVYAFTGWQDMYTRGDLRLIDGLASRHKLLVVDPSTHHGTGHGGEVGAPYGGDTPQEQVENSFELSAPPPAGEDVAWLNRFVKGERNGIEDLPRVRWFDMSDREWRSASSWRSVSDRLTKLHLSAARSGSTKLSPNDGTLSTEVPTGRDSYQDSYVYDPAGGLSVPAGKDGPDGFLPFMHLDQGLDEPHGLTFTTPKLNEPLPLAGPSELRFWAITEASDMAWVVRLADVAPDGSAKLITQGWLRASFRQVDESRSRPGSPYLPDDRQDPVTIGLTTEYRLDIWDTAYTLPAGHRLRLWLGSSDTPTHEPLAVAGRNLIFHDSDHPSHLLLGTRGDGAGQAPAPGCRLRKPFNVRVRSGLRRVRATIDGRRARVSRRGRKRVLVVRPRAGRRVAVVRIAGVDRRGKKVVVRKRYALCR